jgi:hypothetical protein
MSDEIPVADSEDLAEPASIADAGGAADSDSDPESDESAESDFAAETGNTADSDYVPESDESAESDNAAEPDERAGTAYVLAKAVADSDEDTDVRDTAEEGKLRYVYQRKSTSYLVYCSEVLRIRIRDPVLFLPLDSKPMFLRG